MKRRILAVLSAMMIIMSLGSPAFAAQDTLGSPGEANCFGLRTSYHASGGNNGVNPARGNPATRANDPIDLGGNTDDFDSVKDVQAHVKANCQ